MSLENAILNLQAHALSCSGMKKAPETLPEGMGPYPFAITYPERGQLSGESGNLTHEIHTVITEFHIAPRTMLGKAVESATPYISEFFRKLVLDPKLGGEVDTIWITTERPVTYEFGRLKWAGIETIGTRYHISMKIRADANT
jgi:hypothetical protein